MSITLFSRLTCLTRPEVGRTEEGGEGAAAMVAGLFVPCSIEPFINYGERAGVVCARANRGGTGRREWDT